MLTITISCDLYSMKWSLLGYFMWSEWDVPRQMEAKLATESLYISSIVLLPSPSPSSITVSVFFVWFVRFEAFPPTVPVYISYFPALEPVLWTYTMLSSPIYSLKSCVRAFRTSRELCAVLLMANTKAKHHDPHVQNTRVWTQSDGLDAG